MFALILLAGCKCALLCIGDIHDRYMCTDIRYSVKHAFSCRIITQILHLLKPVTRVVAKTIHSVIKLFTCVDSTDCRPLPRLYHVPIGQEKKILMLI